MSASATAAQTITITYPCDAPRRIRDRRWEVILSTEDAVQLYNDLKEALFS